MQQSRRPRRPRHAAGMPESLVVHEGLDFNLDLARIEDVDEERRFSDDAARPFFRDRLTGRLDGAPLDRKKLPFGREAREEREERAREREARKREARGRAAHELEAAGAAHHDRSSVHDRFHRFSSLVDDNNVDAVFSHPDGPTVVLDGEFHGGRHHHHQGGPFGSDMEFHHHGGPRHMEFPGGHHHNGGPFREHNRQERGDHLRSRNRLPEEYENSEWFDSMDDGEGLVDIVLGFFFLVGTVTLLLLPLFMIARALKNMGRPVVLPSSSEFGARRRAHAANVAAAADGYQALPEDGGEEELVEEDDDDAIVVTGTPVNPPPSVHL
ncbi:unnamed protein product [Laminaria digitata]